MTDTTYRRTILVHGDPGVLELTRPAANELQLRAHLPHWEGLIHIVQRARRIFSLDAPVDEAANHLSHDPLIGPLTVARPGLRVPGTWDPFETGVRAIIGEQVSVPGATTHRPTRPTTRPARARAACPWPEPYLPATRRARHSRPRQAGSRRAHARQRSNSSREQSNAETCRLIAAPRSSGSSMRSPRYEALAPRPLTTSRCGSANATRSPPTTSASAAP